MSRIGLVAAMPEECTPLLRRVGAVQIEVGGRFPCHHFHVGDRECCLVRSGMGTGRASEAARILVSRFRPDLIISFGFGGAVLPGPAVGDLVVAERLVRLEGEEFSEQAGLSPEATDRIWNLLITDPVGTVGRFHRGTFLTTDRIENKRELGRRIPPGVSCPVLEMETCAVAGVAHECGVACAAIRGISDDAKDELGFSIEEFTDTDQNVSIPRVLLTLARKPWIIPQLVRLAGNSRLAGRRLAEGILALLERL